MDRFRFWQVYLREIHLCFVNLISVLLFQDAGNPKIKAIKREELENVCMEQAAKIEQLNRLVIRICGAL